MPQMQTVPSSCKFCLPGTAFTSATSSSCLSLLWIRTLSFITWMDDHRVCYVVFLLPLQSLTGHCSQGNPSYQTSTEMPLMAFCDFRDKVKFLKKDEKEKEKSFLALAPHPPTHHSCAFYALTPLAMSLPSFTSNIPFLSSIWLTHTQASQLCSAPTPQEVLLSPMILCEQPLLSALSAMIPITQFCICCSICL